MNEDFYRQVIESIEDYAVFTTDNDGCIRSWNTGAQRLLGYSEAEIIGKDAKILFIPEDIRKHEHIKELQTAIKKGRALDERLHARKNGTQFWSSGLVFPLKDDTGKILGFTKIMRDLSLKREREIAHQRITTKKLILEKISGKLVRSFNYQLTLKQIAELIVPDFADYCRIAIIDEHNKIREIAVHHTDRKKITLTEQLYESYKNIPHISHGIPKILSSGKSEIIAKVDDTLLEKYKTGEKMKQLVKKIGLTSYMGVPLIARGKVIGALTFSSTKENIFYSEDDLHIAQEIAHRIALTLDNFRLFQELEKDLAARTSLAIDNAKLYEKVEQERVKLKALYDANLIGVHICDFNGNIKEANDAFLKLVGSSRKELDNGNINLFKITAPEYIPIDKRAFRMLKSGKSLPTWEKEYIRPDGSQIPVLVGQTVIDFKSKEIISFLLDITERKRLEQRKDEFIGIASHELKTPLTSIKGYIQILERIIEEMGNSKAKRIVSKTNVYINRLNSLITDLLDVSKIQAGKLEFNKEHFDFYDLVQESIENIQTTNSKHVIMCATCPHVTVYGDKPRLEQVFMNLLSNAIKYSPKSDKVLISISHDKKNVKVGVKDFGIGIPVKNQNKIFQRFYRVQKTAKQFSGLGIGLYISAEIVTRHGGEIWVESNEGDGSTFYFTLPFSY